LRPPPVGAGRRLADFLKVDTSTAAEDGYAWRRSSLPPITAPKDDCKPCRGNEAGERDLQVADVVVHVAIERLDRALVARAA